MAPSVPDGLRFADSHEYARAEGDLVRIGISAFAVDQLGDIVFVELPELGTELERGTSFGSVESVKAVEEMYAPLSGTVEARNEAVLASPSIYQPHRKADLITANTRLSDLARETRAAEAEWLAAEEALEAAMG
jgi:glycine cleavage system H protein